MRHAQQPGSAGDRASVTAPPACPGRREDGRIVEELLHPQG